MEEITATRGLLGFSSTCRVLRERSKPFLFYKLTVDSRPLDAEKFVPQSLWPYVV